MKYAFVLYMIIIISELFAQPNQESSQKIFGHWSIIPNMKARENIDFFHNSKSFFIHKKDNKYEIVFPWAYEGAHIERIIKISEEEFEIHYNYGDRKKITKIKFINNDTIVVINSESSLWFPEKEIKYYRIDVIKSFYLEYKATHITKGNDVKIYEFPHIDSKCRTIGRVIQIQVFTDEQIEILKTNGMEGLENQNSSSIRNDGKIGHFVLVSTGVYGWCFIEDLEKIK